MIRQRAPPLVSKEEEEKQKNQTLDCIQIGLLGIMLIQVPLESIYKKEQLQTQLRTVYGPDDPEI